MWQWLTPGRRSRQPISPGQQWAQDRGIPSSPTPSRSFRIQRQLNPNNSTSLHHPHPIAVPFPHTSSLPGPCCSAKGPQLPHQQLCTAPGNALPLPFSLPRAPPASSAIRLLISGRALPSITDCLSTLSFTSPESGRGRQLGPSSSSAESQTHSHLGSTGLCCRAGALLT